MIIQISKIIIKDRIRKDFGDIQELAKDIEENGLINPPVINKEYELLAGERRLRACKSLGWEQIEVRMMDTRDAEHELNVEISENENRKEFSKSERVDYMKRLLRIEQSKAKERQGERTSVEKNADVKRSDEETAKQFDISASTMRKEMTIVDNKNLLDPSDFADWDEGKLSTNKVFQKVKSALQDIKEERDYLEFQLEEEKAKEPEVREVIPADYKQLKKNESAYRQELDRKDREYVRVCNERNALQDRVNELEGATTEGIDHENLSQNVFYFCTVCNNFIGTVGGLVWLTDRIQDMPEKERKMFIKAASSFRDWALVFTQNLNRGMNNERNDGHKGTVLGITEQG